MAEGNLEKGICNLEQYESMCSERNVWGAKSCQRPEWEDWK
jgi:hypothetical protein